MQGTGFEPSDNKMKKISVKTVSMFSSKVDMFFKEINIIKF
jgi:hypothetical protein